MKCEDAKTMLHAWVDQELDPVNSQAFAAHLSQCPSCKADVEDVNKLRAAIKTQATRYKLPPDVYARVADLTSAPSVGSFKSWMPLKWGAMGAAMSMAACMLLFIVLRPDQQYLLQQEIVTSHIHSLQDGHLTDVISTDQHTVKPWFNGRLDISPPVVDLAKDGFPLIGGRLDYLDDHAAAVLVYKYNSHVINLFVWHQKQTSIDLEQSSLQQGYNMRHWQHGDLQFWAVSDVNPVKLAEFEHIYSTRTQ